MNEEANNQFIFPILLQLQREDEVVRLNKRIYTTRLVFPEPAPSTAISKAAEVAKADGGTPMVNDECAVINDMLHVRRIGFSRSIRSGGTITSAPPPRAP